ncbi:MAG TPA: cysteine-rich KTR domain-containing protein [Pseudoflavonifractor sp.]|nr:cysteine-rich KTR domain-containing protein [Pseudoflavonifractor sp.]
MEKLQSTVECDKLRIRKGFIVCPVCKQPTNQAVRPDTSAQNLQLWCRNCKAVHVVNIDLGQCYVISRCQ